METMHANELFPQLSPPVVRHGSGTLGRSEGVTPSGICHQSCQAFLAGQPTFQTCMDGCDAGLKVCDHVCDIVGAAIPGTLGREALTFCDEVCEDVL